MGQVLLISGNDEPRIAERARAVVDKLTGPQPDEFSLETHRESDETTLLDAIREAIGGILTPSMFGGEKTVWLRDFPFANEGTQTDIRNKAPIALAVGELLEAITSGLPEEIHLVISGAGLQKNRRVYKTLAKIAKPEFLTKPELNNRNWRNGVAELLRSAATERAITLPRGAVEYLTEVIGVDTARIPNECEKIFCYAGNQPSLAQIRDVCVGNRDAVFYALTDGFGKRDLNLAYQSMAQVLGHTKDPESAVIGQLRMVCKYFREMLAVKVLAHELNSSSVRLEALTAEQRQRFRHSPALAMTDFKLRMVCEAARKYKGSEITTAISLLARADRLAVSSSLPRRVMLETIAARIILGKKATA